MAEWKPRSDGIKELVTLLVESQQPGADQQKILSKLDEYRRLPEFNNYLAHIVAQGDNFPIEVRQSAGLLLKNNLKAAKGGISDESKAYVKSAILPAIGHPHESIRATVGTTLAVLAASGAMERWPEIPSALMSALYGDNSHAQQGALDTFIKILEDSPQQMTIQPPGLQEKPSCLVVPRTLQLFQSDDATVRKLAVRLLNQLASTLMPPALVDALREYINGLYFLAGQDTTSETRKEVCTGLTQMLQIHPQLLEEQLTNVIQFMLTATQSEEEGVALESCDFWSAFCESKLDPAALEPFLAQLVPVLLKNMIYDEHDEDIIEAEAAEAEAAGSTVGNRDQDLRPFHRQHPAHVSGAGVLDNGMEEEELAGGDDDDEEDGVRWNLRKSSARGLDFLSSTEWRLKESAILALGAIADGCMAGLAQLVPTMVAVFLRMADDQHPLVRSHTCWTMGRYSHLLIEQAVQEGKFEQLDAVVTKLLERLLDGNRFVQKSACTGVATLVEDAAEKITFDPLASKLPMMLQAIATVLARYSKRMMRSLYDVISTLCEAAKSYMCEPQYANLLLPPLIAKWRTMDNADKELLPLMECLAFALTHTKSCCEQYAPEVLKRSLELAEAHLELLKKERQGHLLPGEVEPDEDFVALALYTVSGLVEGLGASMQPLLVQRSSFIPLLAACCQDPSADIRAEAFALLGDLSKVTPSQLLDHATGFCQAALHNLQPAMLSATNARSCTNACWALTRLLPLMPQQQSQSLVLHCLQVSVPLIEAPKQQVPPKLRENSAILVSCAAAISPAEVGSHMPRFLGPWSGSVAPMRAGPEKAVATHGLLQALKANPQVATHSLPSVVSALMSWRQQDCPAGVWADLVAVLKAFQDMMGVAWSEMVANLQPGLQSKLQQLLAS